MLNTQEPQPTITSLAKEDPAIVPPDQPAVARRTQDWGATAPHQDAPAPHDETFEDAPSQEPGSDGVVQYKDFEDMDLPEQLLRGIYAFGFEKPSAIQQKAIVPAASGRDVVMHAQSGTGKTGSFGIGLLARIQPRAGQTQALILSPTRDLADQTHRVGLITAVSALQARTPELRCLSFAGHHSAWRLPWRNCPLLDRGPLWKG